MTRKDDNVGKALADSNRTVRGQAIVSGDPLTAQKHQRATQADNKARAEREAAEE